MRLFLTLVFLLHAVNLLAEPCHYIVNINDLKKIQENGQTLLAFDEKVIDKSKHDGCFYPVQTGQYIKKLVKDAEDYQTISREYNQLIEKVEKLNHEYKSLIANHEATLNRSVNLTEKYTQQVDAYNKLASDYDGLAVKFDKLAEGYRKAALSTSSFISFDIGAGATNGVGAAGILGLGIKLNFLCQQLKIWGVYQKDNSGGLIGCSFGF